MWLDIGKQMRKAFACPADRVPKEDGRAGSGKPAGSGIYRSEKERQGDTLHLK